MTTPPGLMFDGRRHFFNVVKAIDFGLYAVKAAAQIDRQTISSGIVLSTSSGSGPQSIMDAAVQRFCMIGRVRVSPECGVSQVSSAKRGILARAPIHPGDAPVFVVPVFRHRSSTASTGG